MTKLTWERVVTPAGVRREGLRAVALLLSALPAAAMPGCAGSGGQETISVAHQKAATKNRSVAEQIERDPLAYLRSVQARCDAIPKYRLTFYRQERLGLFQQLAKMEKIEVKFRAEPFSVRFYWPNPDASYDESVYVANANEGKLIVRERKGFLGLPPATHRVDPMASVTFGRSKQPITDFGLSRMMERTIGSIVDPPKGEPAKVSYEGIVTLAITGVEAHHVVIRRAPTKKTPCDRQDLWIDTETGLPAGTRLVLPDGRTDGLYLYADVTPDPSLSDKDFTLSEKGTDTQPAETGKGKGKGEAASKGGEG
jgi:hypothetical protein